MSPTGPRKPSEHRERPSQVARAPLVRPGSLARRRARTVRLPLLRVDRDDRASTNFVLDLRITCPAPGGPLRFDVRADFGSIPPHRAVLTVLKSRHEALPPVPVVERGVSVPRIIDVPLDPATERIFFWVETEGAACVPARLVGVLRLGSGPGERVEADRVPGEPAPDDEIDTMRLPTRKLAVKALLAAALGRSTSPHLVLLGRLMQANDLDGKIDLLRRLLAAGVDLRLVEAAVQDVALSEHMVAGFPRVRVERLDLSEPALACLAVFHPASPPHVVRQCLAASIERCTSSGVRGDWDWSRLARGAALVLVRRARPELDAEFLATKLEGDAVRLACLEEVIGWAESRRPPPPPRLSVPFRECLERAAGTDPERAEGAVHELLAYCGFVGVSGEVS